jgi:hypothetical protein
MLPGGINAREMSSAKDRKVPMSQTRSLWRPVAFQRRLCKIILVGEVASKVGSADPQSVSQSNVSPYIALVTNFG